MLVSVRWLCELLEDAALSEAQIERALTQAGFPIEDRQELASGDVQLDVEITSNRGDCLSHVGLAREIAAQTGCALRAPVAPEPALAGAGLVRDAGGALAPAQTDQRASDLVSLEVQDARACPRFTLRVIRGARVGPSPRWLVEKLEAVGQRPINNVVDASNFVLHELGQPTHTFDLRSLEGGRVVVRFASKGERLVTLDGVERELAPEDLVVADAARARSLAGVMGGEDSGVTEATTDVLLEAATWDPATIRRAARRHQLFTDASHRFERLVDPRTIDVAAARLAALLVELTGGTLLPGVVEGGAPLDREKTVVPLRLARCQQLLGFDVATEEAQEKLAALEIQAQQDPQDPALLRCAIPFHRPDLAREVDLIEEVGRTLGYDRAPVHDRVRVAPPPLQASEQARRTLCATLAAAGFFETITFSFVTRDEAQLHAPRGRRVLCVDEARRPGAPALRPSVIPSLLLCRKRNLDALAGEEGEALRLFETASVFAEDETTGHTVEEVVLALLLDAPEAQRAVRQLRGALELAAQRLGGAETRLELLPAEPPSQAFREDACAQVLVGGQEAGWAGMVSDRARALAGLETPAAAAEIRLEALLALYPPTTTASRPPAFPAVVRDLCVLVGEATLWRDIAEAIERETLAMLESVELVDVFRSAKLGKGVKSVTLRLRFRAADRTLRSEEVDEQMARALAALERSCGARLRS